MKKKMGRKLISIMLAFAMVLTGAAIAVPGVSDEAYASTNGHTQSEAVAWAKAKADEHYEINDGSGWTQCTEFVWAYYEYLIGRHVNGDAYQYLTDEFGACPLGWTRPETTNVQPGDIVIWNQYASFNAANSDYTFEHGHIGVVVEVNGNNMTTVEANAYGAPRGRTECRYDREVSYIDGLIRPDFAPEIIPIDKATVTVPDATYTGKKLTPKPVVTYEGKTLVKGTDYKCLYKNNKDIGLATVTITGIENCKGSIKANFKIIPKGVSISKLSPAETTILAIWKPQLSKPAITGYQIGYSESSDMSEREIIANYDKTECSIQSIGTPVTILSVQNTRFLIDLFSDDHAVCLQRNKKSLSGCKIAFMPRKLLYNEQQHGKLGSYGEETPMACLSALSHKSMLPEAHCQADRGINAVACHTSFE